MKPTLRFHPFRFAAVGAALMLFAAPSLALDHAARDTITVKGSDFTVQVIDGKVFVNGEEVDEGASLVFENDDDDVHVFMNSKRGRFGDGNAFAFRFGPDEGREHFRAFFGDGPDVGREMLRKHFVGPMMDKQVLFFSDDDDLFGFEDVFTEYTDAEMREMEREASRLAREARRAEGDEREKLEAELQEKLEAIFERKMELREKRVEKLEEALEEARTRLEERRKAREEIIQRRLRDLLGEEDLYEW
ncbi:hypothetical protein [Rhodocaloribacter sp.]